MALQEYVYLVYIISVVLLTYPIDGKSCDTRSPCMCEYDDGSGTVDITSIGNTDGTPSKNASNWSRCLEEGRYKIRIDTCIRMKDRLAADNRYRYSYNPCQPFTEGNCQDVAVCEVLDVVRSTPYTTPAGSQDGAQFNMDGNDLKITYKTKNPDFDFTTNVILKCDPSVTDEPKWEVQGTQSDLSIKLGMTHKCVCPNACVAANGSLSVGSILCIVFFVCLIIYFAAGAAFQFFVKKESGRNVVPNISFWSELPGYIKDGGSFVVNKAKGKGGYSEI